MPRRREAECRGHDETVTPPRARRPSSGGSTRGSSLASGEKQIQQSCRPIVGVHKWFARRPGALLRGLLLAEFGPDGPLERHYFRPHALPGITVADPFMGGGTTLFEANRLGCNVAGFDINPMSYWVVRQELSRIDRGAFRQAADAVLGAVEREIGKFYATRCGTCGRAAPVKYFLWVKQQRCGGCGRDLDLFPGYLVARNERHTHFVLHCPRCRRLVQSKELPPGGRARCPGCRESFDWRRGAAAGNRYRCGCGHEGRYPAELRGDGPPRHRLFGLEYHCPACRGSHEGRWFKTADLDDLRRYGEASGALRSARGLIVPAEDIPPGDETKRLHRWGYRSYREMFNDRQLLALGLLARRIRSLRDREARHALATVFSDMLRYQNMLCRYDTGALKCQDIFAVHGFPVGLVQCENNVPGIPGVGGGGFRHFVEKYDRAKAYGESPFETSRRPGGPKRTVPVRGEEIGAEFVGDLRRLRGGRRACLFARPVDEVECPPGRWDAVFTDPPYFDNVQYAELMDFCYVWLRRILEGEVPEFRAPTTRSDRELTGNVTLGRGLRHFAEGLSRVFSAAARALKPGAPFVFTYHHNDLEAYVPVAAAVLDAGLACTAALPCPSEMAASLHINGTGSSVVDTIVVCRKGAPPRGPAREDIGERLKADRELLARGGVRCTEGDLRCLALGHLARAAVRRLAPRWDPSAPVGSKIERVEACLRALAEESGLEIGDRKEPR